MVFNSFTIINYNLNKSIFIEYAARLEYYEEDTSIIESLCCRVPEMYVLVDIAKLCALKFVPI